MKRPELDKRHPLHVTIKLVAGLPKLRQKKYFRLVQGALLKAKAKGLRVIHFSVQSNHVHLIVESSCKEELSCGMQSLCTSLAKRINFHLGRCGSVFKDRYHIRVLKTPGEIKKALVYVFQNWAKHSGVKWRFDPYSTLLGFGDKVALGLGKVNTSSLFPSVKAKELVKEELCKMTSKPKTWLLVTGWKKAYG